jgi:hypothetical protein
LLSARIDLIAPLNFTTFGAIKFMRAKIFLLFGAISSKRAKIFLLFGAIKFMRAKKANLDNI